MRDRIDKFMACKKFAVAGVSRTSYKTGSAIFCEMKNSFSGFIQNEP